MSRATAKVKVTRTLLLEMTETTAGDLLCILAANAGKQTELTEQTLDTANYLYEIIDAALLQFHSEK